MSTSFSQEPKEERVAQEFLNRELSWLEFNRRVLHEAIDERTPLLERVRFLGIFTSNLDEFFMKRVGGLKRQIAAGVTSLTPDGLTQEQQLTAIRTALIPMLEMQSRCFKEKLLPELKEQGVFVLTYEELNESERVFVKEYFATNVFPVLTPLAVDPGHPFPFISNLSTSLAVSMRHPDKEERLFARVKVPQVLPAWVRLNPPGQMNLHRFVSLKDILLHHLGDLFPNMKLLQIMPFRITRNVELERDEDDAEDLLEMIEQELRERRFARIVRLEHGHDADPWIRQFLMQSLDLQEEDIYEVPGELDYTSLKAVMNLPLPKLTYPVWTSTIPQRLHDEDQDIFNVIKRGDLLVHHPYESFGVSVERFIQAAAKDPNVLCIKMTVYRTGEESPFIPTLIRAAESGKQIACIVELKARFDEARNIYWAQALESAGVHVVYGIVGLKTHCKTALVVRKEADGLRTYVHIGTGNYNSLTARLYTDFGIFTCRPEYTEDVSELFNFLTGRSLKRDYRKLLVAPVNMRDRILELIERETQHALAGRPARIVAKMNSMEERTTARALYKASQAGVEVDLIVRGFCCLRPGVPGLSEKIRVISVIGRFLEHSRVMFFQNGKSDPLDGDFYIGSADWMYRNFLARVEALAPVEGRAMRERLWELMQVMLADRRQAWDMNSNGVYVQRVPTGDPNASQNIGTHQYFMNLAREKAGVPGTIGLA